MVSLRSDSTLHWNLLENTGKLLENTSKFEVFGTKMKICSTKMARNNQARQAVATRGSINGPNGRQNGQKIDLKIVFFSLPPILPSECPYGIHARPPASDGRRPTGRPTETEPQAPSFLPLVNRHLQAGPAVRGHRGAVPPGLAGQFWLSGCSLSVWLWSGSGCLAGSSGCLASLVSSFLKSKSTGEQ